VFFFGVFLLLFFIFRLWLSSFGGIHPDEAYYWVWAEDLKIGYFDHPPMVAWLIGIGQEVFSWFQDPHSSTYALQLSFRWMPYFVSSVLTPLLLGHTIELVQKAPLRLIQMFALWSTPIFFLGPQIITPDLPFFCAWAFSLFIVIKLLRQQPKNTYPGDSTRFSLQISLLAGLSLALAAYSKISAILAAFLLVITGLGLANSLLTAGIALILTLPYFIWNYTIGLEEGAGIAFQFNNATQPLSSPPNWKRVGDLWAAQFFMWSPFLFVLTFFLSLASLRRFFMTARRSTLTGTLFLWTILPLLFFSITGLRRPAEANWPLMGSLSATVLVISRLEKYTTTLFFLICSNVLTLFLGWILLFQGPWVANKIESFSPRAAKMLRKPSRIREFRYWDQLREFLAESTLSDQRPVLVQSYQLLSTMLFYDAAKPEEEKLADRLKIWAEGSRLSEFNIREKYSFNTKGKSFWLLTYNDSLVPKNCLQKQILFRGEDQVDTYKLFSCE